MKEVLKRVKKAEQYRSGALTKLGDAKRMLLVQHAFPNTYSPIDTLLVRKLADVDIQRDVHSMKCLLDNTSHGTSMLKAWIFSATEQDIFRFLIDLFEADEERDWTGYRITASVAYDQRIWFFELFSKHPASHTVVYSGYVAPNVIAKQ